MATSSRKVWDVEPNRRSCRARGDRTPQNQDHHRDRGLGTAATGQPGGTAHPLRQPWLPLPHRPTAAARALLDLDPQGRQQDRHPHLGHHPGGRPASAAGQLPTATRAHLRARSPGPATSRERSRATGPLTGLSARALSETRLGWSGEGHRRFNAAMPRPETTARHIAAITWILGSSWAVVAADGWPSMDVAVSYTHL